MVEGVGEEGLSKGCEGLRFGGLEAVLLLGGVVAVAVVVAV